MLISELRRLIAQGEGPKLEFKRDAIRPELMAREVVAFANMNGGQILVGVEDEGGISGVKRANFQTWLMDTVIGRYVHPLIVPNYETVIVTDSCEVGVVSVPMGVAKPYVLRHNNREEIYVRYGNVCQLAGREQQVRLFASGGMLSAERLPVHGASIADLDERRVAEYFYTVLSYPQEADLEKLLIDHGFLVGDAPRLSCSYFAHALFASAPQLRLPQSGLRFTVYDGEDKDYDARFDRIFNKPLVEYRGSSSRVPEPVESALHRSVHFEEHLSHQTLVKMTRITLWDYPEKAVREIIINAHIHRDWTKQDYVRVVAYSNRLEVISPGALPNGMTIEKIKNGVVLQRNPIAAGIFRNYGYLEQQGMGIRRKVIPLMQQHNGRAPDFEATDDYFKVTLWKKSTN